MKAIVAIKQTLDAASPIRIAASKRLVDTTASIFSINPFCEIALEESVRWKEKSIITSLTAVTVGPARSDEILRHALAFGADKAIRIHSENENEFLTPIKIGQIISDVARENEASVVFMGKQAIDGDYGQTGQMVAAMLGWSQGTFISKIELSECGKQFLITRETSFGSQALSSRLPAVITCDLRLNQPRYVNLSNLIKSRKKLIEVITPPKHGTPLKATFYWNYSWTVSLSDMPHFNVESLETPITRKSVRWVASVSDLLIGLK